MAQPTDKPVYAQIYRAEVTASNLSDADFRLFVLLKLNRNVHNESWWSASTLAAALGRSRMSIHRSLQSLVKHKYIRRKGRKGKSSITSLSTCIKSDTTPVSNLIQGVYQKCYRGCIKSVTVSTLKKKLKEEAATPHPKGAGGGGASRREPRQKPPDAMSMADVIKGLTAAISKKKG